MLVRAIEAVGICMLFIFGILLGLYIADDTDENVSVKTDTDTYWTEIYEGTGEVVIHTKEQYVKTTNGNIFIKGKTDKGE